MSVTRYDVNGPSSVFEDVNGSLVDFKDYGALEDKRAALAAELKQSKIDADCYKKGMEASNARLVQLAAENAALKSKAAELVHEASEVYSAYNSSITEHDGDFMDMQTLQEMQCVETTATDAFLAEVRASAVDDVCLKISNAIVNCYQDEQIGLDAAATICGDFAAQLRKGDAL
ncbi:hypothetical protein [Citrobacter amalonaticus]|uniref:hypothetical protein n=1 Tax=Citrobacter amalonaticus TaxID=35703 RepID=UPI0018AA9121|nr:hypothetical protein [Citrobacter amalonaticus]